VTYPQVAAMGDRLATIDMDRKLRGLCPFGAGRAESPSNAMWPGLRPTSIRNESIQPFSHDRHGPWIILRLATCGHGLQCSSQDRILQAGVGLIYTSTRFTAKESTSSYELTHTEIGLHGNYVTNGLVKSNRTAAFYICCGLICGVYTDLRPSGSSFSQICRELR